MYDYKVKELLFLYFCVVVLHNYRVKNSLCVVVSKDVNEYKNKNAFNW